MSPTQEEHLDEHAIGILKSNVTYFCGIGSLFDAEQNFTNLVDRLREQIKALEHNKSDRPDAPAILKAHNLALEELERCHQKGIVFNKNKMMGLAMAGGSFSLEETPEESSRRENAYNARLVAIAEDLNKVLASQDASLGEKEAAFNEARAKKNQILRHKEASERRDQETMARNGLSKALWGESFEEMMERQMAER